VYWLLTGLKAKLRAKVTDLGATCAFDTVSDDGHTLILVELNLS
jgi:hypothetical protein